MPDRLSCDDVSTRDLIARYVSGRASEAEAEALEQHVLDCDACGAELQATVEARAAFKRHGAESSSSIAPTTRARPSRVAALAVAAVLLLAVGGVWEWRRTREPDSLTRGARDPLSLSVEWQPDGSLKLSWPAQPGAVVYRLQISSATAEPVFEQVTVPSLTIEAAVMARLPEPSVEVEAQGSDGSVVARSAATRVPGR